MGDILLSDILSYQHYPQQTMMKLLWRRCLVFIVICATLVLPLDGRTIITDEPSLPLCPQNGRPCIDLNNNFCSGKPIGQIYAKINDCNKFYMCGKDRHTWIHQCPGSLLFDSQILNCNWSHLAQCLE